MAEKFDIIIIGGGPGGYVAAIRAAQLGMKVALVEDKHLGGICLNWGCIPTKALLRSADNYRLMLGASAFGLKADNIGFDIEAIVKRSRGVSRKLNQGVTFLLKKNKVTVYDGFGTLAGKGLVAVSKDGKSLAELMAKHIIIATGARARILPEYAPDEKLVWTYHEAMIPETMPKSLIIIGSGAIGIEFASFYRTMGAEVTVLEIAPQILPVEDAEIAELARKSFEKQGIEIHTGVVLGKLEKGKNDVKLGVQIDGKPHQLTAERMIVAVGVQGNIENLGLESVGVKTDRCCIVIDEFSRTNIDGIYAIGDVAGPPMLAHKAEHEGVICVEKIAGLDIHPLNKGRIAGCTYCHPQIASVGLTEAKAVELAGQQNFEIKVGRFPFIANGKAIALGETEGMVKTIFNEKTGALIGAHMVGAEVTELIQGYVIAMGLETTEAELMHTVFPHPDSIRDDA